MTISVEPPSAGGQTEMNLVQPTYIASPSIKSEARCKGLAATGQSLRFATSTGFRSYSKSGAIADITASTLSATTGREQVRQH